MSRDIDHRLLAEEMNLYFIDPQIGAGLPVWLPNGVAIRDELESFVKELERNAGYQRVVSPHLGKESLYECSGHLRHYKADMFPAMRPDDGGESYFLKPMNCPHHHKVFASSHRSYRQLPLRIAEYGQVYRFEPSGSLRGLGRVRGLCQNDAHIYVQPERAYDEILEVLRLHEVCYRALGLSNYRFRLSKHDPKRGDDFQGDSQKWIECENILRRALVALGLSFFEAVGEAAFYGPKIDVQMKLGGAEESMSSVQLDFVSGERFDLKFSESSGEKRVPWVIHRAPLGSHERFVAMLLEAFQGRLPGWLAPIQLAILPVSQNEVVNAHKIRLRLHREGIRGVVIDGAGSLSKRLQRAHLVRPFAKVIIGSKDVESGSLNLQLRDREFRIEISDLSRRLQAFLCRPWVDSASVGG
jgi:threonyl-tRNA synthetase